MSQDDDSQGDVVTPGSSEDEQEGPPSLSRMRGNGAELDPEAERELWRGHISWKHFADLIGIVLAWSILAAIIGLSAGGWLGWFMFVMVVVGWVFVLGRIAYGMLYFQYRLTNQRLFVEKGVFGKTIDQTELMRVDDVRIRKSLFDRMTGLGSLLIMSTDTSDPEVMIVGVPEPDKLADTIRENMRILRRQALYVERL